MTIHLPQPMFNFKTSLSLLKNFQIRPIIFTNQSILVTEIGVYPTLHPKCHHQTFFAELVRVFNLGLGK